jgi:hypothetical protein
MKHLNELLRTTATCASVAGFVFFCAYGFTQRICIVNSVVSFTGSVGCLAAYVKTAYPGKEEAKN